jgi:DNA segregation ATPase FtsK/SpoIIIE, S-DNA-T family
MEPTGENRLPAMGCSSGRNWCTDRSGSNGYSRDGSRQDGGLRVTKVVTCSSLSFGDWEILMSDDIERGTEFERQGHRQSAAAAYKRAFDAGVPESALTFGNFLREIGDLPQAEAVYREGDRRGDSRCSFNLGFLLENCGDTVGAEAAYRRADAANLLGGARALADLCRAKGDTDGALAATRHADELGDPVAAYNLGLLLTEMSDSDGARAAFRRADERGHPGGAVSLGERYETEGRTQDAEAAFRRAYERGDSSGAFALGGLLYDAGRLAEARQALERAAELGHPAASGVLTRLADEFAERDSAAIPVMARRPKDPHRAAWAVGQIVEAIGRQREVLAQITASAETNLGVALSRLAALDAEFTQRDLALNRFLGEDPRSRPTSTVRPGRGLPDRFLTKTTDGPSRVRPDIGRSFANLLEIAVASTVKAESKRFGVSKFADEARESIQRYVNLLSELAAARDAMRIERDAALKSKREALAVAEQTAAEALGRARELQAGNLSDVTLLMSPWESDAWSLENFWSDIRSDDWSFAGWLTATPDPGLGTNSNFGCDVRLPLYVEGNANLIVAYDETSRQPALALAQSLLLRRLAAFQPGDVVFHLFDPIGLGQSVTELLQLADFDPGLIAGKVWSSTQDLRSMLAEISTHIEMVVQKYLRADYANLEEFNAAAGEIAVPNRTVVLLDFPTGFDRDAMRDLTRILDSGPRCGVQVLVAHNVASASTESGLPDPYPSDVRFLDLRVPFGIKSGAYRLSMVLQPDSAGSARKVTSRLVETVGRRSASTPDAVLSLDRLMEIYSDAARRGLRPERSATSPLASIRDSSAWWTARTVSGISAPIGQKGARDAAVLTFDSSDHTGALLVGRPGSGKSTLLHAFILGAVTQYSPEELELYLIDFKEGVEFKAYAAEGLPHARCVAIESDREFGLSVLQALSEEISLRGAMLRGSGGQYSGLEALRRETGQTLPRVLLVFDEFHVLFSRNDKTGIAAADLLEQIIRQGRAFGIHVLLGSQSLSGLDALGSHVPQLLPVRILLAAAENDGRRVLGEGNNAGQYLTARGEGILNPAGGSVEANERFRGALISDERRIEALRELRHRADTVGFSRRPIIFDGNVCPPLGDVDPARFLEESRTSQHDPLRLRVGVPMSIHGTADVVLRRESGANVLVIARGSDGIASGFAASPETPQGLLVAMLASLVPTPTRTHVVDFTAIDDGTDALLQPLLRSPRFSVTRRRGLSAVLNECLTITRNRVAEDDNTAPPVVIVLFGLHKARDLDPQGASLDADMVLVDNLEEILRDGPEVGVHTWVWADSPSSVTRRLTSAAIREFGWRVASKMSADDSQSLLGIDLAGSLRAHQVIIVNDDLGIQKRATSYSVPETFWLDEILRTSLPPPES